jgi:hypothetical protein
VIPVLPADLNDGSRRWRAQRWRWRSRLQRVSRARKRFVILDAVGLDDIATPIAFERVWGDETRHLRPVHADTHARLRPAADLAVLVIDERRRGGLHHATLVALVGRQIVEALAVVTDPPLGLTHDPSIPT